MSLQEELGLKTKFHSKGHEALLSIYHTTAMLRKLADVFFADFQLTDVQFNVLALVHFQGGQAGVSQVDLSRMMLVNRANITSLVDRMEAAELVRRVPDPHDRRYKIIQLTAVGEQRLQDVYEPYKSLVAEVLQDLSGAEVAQLTSLLAKVRAGGQRS